VRRLALLVALAGCLVAPGPAEARFVLGIGDQSTAMLGDPRFAALGVRDSRLVVPWDVAVDPASLARYAPVLDLARARGVRMLVSFAASARTPRRLPSASAYGRAVRAFRARFPWVTELGAWNEANHASQPTARHPGRAARLYQALRRACPRCRIVAADVLDQRGFAGWVRSFRRVASGARIWGLHDYVDVNHFRDVSIPRLRRATGGRGQVWLTETGGVVRFAQSFAYDERRAARATRHVLRLAERRRVRRVYLYQWTGAPLGARWDSGLVAADGRARPALKVVEAWLGVALTPLPPIPAVPPFPRAPGEPPDTGGVLAPDQSAALTSAGAARPGRRGPGR
jgi:hypothetical protein